MRDKNDILKAVTLTMGSVSLSMAITYALCMIWGENHLIGIDHTLAIAFIAPLIITPIVCTFFIRLNYKLKKTEQLLRDENHWRELLLEESGDAIVVADENAKVYTANTRFAEMLGYSKEEIEQFHVWDWDVNFNQNQILDLAASVDVDGHHFVSQHRRKDGGIIDVELANSGTIYGGKKLILCICRDITDRKKAEKEREELVEKLQASLSEAKTLRGMLESVEYFNRILDEAELGVWDVKIDVDEVGLGAWDLPVDKEQVFFSDHCLKIAGYSPGDLGTTPFEVFETWTRKTHPEDLAGIIRAIKEAAYGESEKIEMSYRVQCKDGGWKWILSKGVVVERDPDGKSVRAAGVKMDIDVVINTEAEKRRAQKRFERIVEKSHLGIIIIEDGVIRYANDSVQRIGGYSQDEIIGRQFVDFADEADKSMVSDRYLNRLKGYNVPSCYTFRGVNKAGSQRWIEANSMAFEWEERPTTLVFLRDVTLEKALEKHEVHSQKIEAIGTLAGGIAHDFNNILTSIMGFTEICMMETPPENRVSGRLGHIMDAAERAKDLVGQILSFSHRDETTLQAVNLELIVKEVVKFIRVSTPATITVLSDISREIGSIMADPTQLHQVVMNLCTNAVYAMRESGGVLDVTLSEYEIGDKDPSAVAKGLAPGEYVHLSVCDTGHGMSPETVKNIFDPYFTTKPIGEGTGLGLSVAYGIIDGFGGTIDVCSLEGKGSSFHVYLPKHSSETGDVKITKHRPIVGGKETILLVDDEAVQLGMVQERLEALGYTVVPCYNGIEAFQAFSDSPKRFDLVFTDHAMPGMTGLELARRIRETNSTLPIVLYSGFTGDIPSRSVADYGIGAVLNKPALMRDIARTIRGLLDQDLQEGSEHPVPDRKHPILIDADIRPLGAELN